jgi:hypothetical protein
MQQLGNVDPTNAMDIQYATRKLDITYIPMKRDVLCDKTEHVYAVRDTIYGRADQIS